MREDICSIPISEIFEPKDGCPFCRMRDMLEARMATYITGAAMMEPDVRVETNRLGFCHQHFEQILQRGSRLSVALILESLLDEAGKDILPEDDKLAPKKILAAADRRAHSCFVCENVEKNMQHLSATVIKLWQSEPEFRTLYSEQTHICLPHYSFILTAAQKMPFSRLRQKPSALQKTISIPSRPTPPISAACSITAMRAATGAIPAMPLSVPSRI